MKQYLPRNRNLECTVYLVTKTTCFAEITEETSSFGKFAIFTARSKCYNIQIYINKATIYNLAHLSH